MALNLGIFERIGTYLGFGSGGANREAQNESNEHDGKHSGLNADDLKDEGGSQDKGSDNHTPAGDNSNHDWQNSKYTISDFEYEYQDTGDTSGLNNYADADQHGEHAGSVPSDLNHASNDYYDVDVNAWENDGGDLHAVLAGLSDTGAMLDAAISHLDSSIPCDIGALDVAPLDDHGGSTGMS